VQQFEVTFYSPEGKKVNNQPILSNSSPQDDKYLPAGLDSSQIPSNTLVSRLDITVLKTTDSQSPKGVVLDIQACTQAAAGKCLYLLTHECQINISQLSSTIFLDTTVVSTESTATTGSTGAFESSVSQSVEGSGTVSSHTTLTSRSASTQVPVETGSSLTPSSLTTPLESTTAALEATTTIECAEMQAVDEAVSKLITVAPNELPEGANVDFQPTSKQGVSFPSNDTTPTITVHFGKPAHVRSVTIPRDTTQNANVQQFEVTFYSPEGKKVNNQPILSNLSPQDDKYLPAGLDSSQIPSNTPVSRLDITVLKTTDSQSPKGVVLDIQACTQAGAGKCLYLLTHECQINISQLSSTIFLDTTVVSTESTATTGSTGAFESSVSQSVEGSGTVSSRTIVTSVSGSTQGASSLEATSVASATGSITVSSETEITSLTSEVGSTQVASGTGSTLVTSIIGVGSTVSPLSTLFEYSTSAVAGTSPKQCEEIQLVDEVVSRNITVTPSVLPEGGNIEFQVTSEIGVTFPDNDRTPTITVTFEKATEVQSVTIPTSKIPNANVQQFEVTFYSPDGKKINDKPISSNSSGTDDSIGPAGLDSSQLLLKSLVSRIEITVVHTTDGESPKGVVLDIKACTETRSGQYGCVVLYLFSIKEPQF
jgi:hypothetical protein